MVLSCKVTAVTDGRQKIDMCISLVPQRGMFSHSTEAHNKLSAKNYENFSKIPVYKLLSSDKLVFKLVSKIKLNRPTNILIPKYWLLTYCFPKFLENMSSVWVVSIQVLGRQ